MVILFFSFYFCPCFNQTRSKSTGDQNPPDQNQPSKTREPLTDRGKGLG